MSQLRFLVLTQGVFNGVLLMDQEDAEHAATGEEAEDYHGVDSLADAFRDLFEDDQPEQGFEKLLVDVDQLRASEVKTGDDLAVNDFTLKMRKRLAEKRAQGYSGWDDPNQCSVERLRALYFHAVAKGDLLNVANYAMMLSYRGAELVPAVDPEGVEAAAREDFNLYCQRKGIDPEGQFAQDDGWPLFSAGYSIGQRANPVTDNLAARTWSRTDTEYMGLKQDLGCAIKGVQGAILPSTQMVDIIAVFNMHGFQVTRIPGNTQDNRESLLKRKLL